MRQEEPIGMWEVKNCTTFMAKSLCKQDANFREKSDTNKQPNYDEGFNSCMHGWESDHYLLNCYKVKNIEQFHGKPNEMNLDIHFHFNKTWDNNKNICH